MRDLVMTIALLFTLFYHGFCQKEELMQMMHNNLNQKQNLSLTGDPDFDFATIMLIHHKCGIDMANKEILEGSNPGVIAMAKKIKASQEKDLANLKKFTTNVIQEKSSPEFLGEIKEQIEKSRIDMESKMTMTGKPDKDFLSFMTLHHQQGQEMGKIHYKYGKNSSLKQMTKKMLNVQKLQENQLVNLSASVEN